MYFLTKFGFCRKFVLMIVTQPQSKEGLSSLVGCSLLKQRIRKVTLSCMRRGAVLPHILFYGLGGTGKTAFARAIGVELGYYVVVSEAASMKTRKQVLENFDENLNRASHEEKTLLWFIDEIHRFSTDLQEALYYPMKDWIDSGKVPAWTLVAATTRKNELDGDSFVTRFKYQWRMGRYADHEIREILARYFRDIGLNCGPREITAIGNRSLGIPRIALRLAEMVRDEVYSSHHRDLTVMYSDVLSTFDLEGIDDRGLTRDHRCYLLELHSARGEPRGIKTLAGKLGMAPSVVEGSIEPILLSLGMVDATRSGRKLTSEGYLHLANQGLA